MARTQVAICSQMSPVCGDDSIVIWDIITGNTLSTYKYSLNPHQSSMLMVPRHCLDRIGYQYLVSAYQNSPILNVWSLDRKDRLYMKMILPGNVQALCFTRDGSYCLVGIETKLYVWQTSSGYLFNVLDKHYQSIRVIRITNDMSYFITGADDGIIMIWDFSKVIVTSSESFSVVDGRSSQQEPEKIITNSSMSVVDIHMSLQSGRQSRFVTCSEQSSVVKIYQLPTGDLSATISFPSSIVSVLMDRIESSLFCGSTNGNVYEVRLSQIGSTDSLEKNIKKDADGRYVHFDFSSLEDDCSESSLIQKYSGHSGAVCSMAVTIDGQGLLSGSNDNTIRLWHISTHQCMRTNHYKGPISNIIVFPSMCGLFLFDSLESTNYSLNNIDSNQVDISLSSFCPQTTSGKKNKKSNSTSSPSFSSIYSRPQSIEQTLRTAPNPPKTIATFKRDIFRLRFNPINLIQTRLSNTIREVEPSESGMLNAFDHGGSLLIRNNQSLGQNFTPWQKLIITDLKEELARIYPQQQIDQELMRLMMEHMGQQKQKTMTNTKRKKKSDDQKDDPSGGQEDDCKMSKFMVNGQHDDDDIDEYGNKKRDSYKIDSSSSATSGDIQREISKLHDINYQLYRYAIDMIFKNIDNANDNDVYNDNNPNKDDIPEEICLTYSPKQDDFINTDDTNMINVIHLDNEEENDSESSMKRQSSSSTTNLTVLF